MGDGPCKRKRVARAGVRGRTGGACGRYASASVLSLLIHFHSSPNSLNTNTTATGYGYTSHTRGAKVPWKVPRRMIDTFRVRCAEGRDRPAALTSAHTAWHTAFHRFRDSQHLARSTRRACSARRERATRNAPSLCERRRPHHPFTQTRSTARPAAAAAVRTDIYKAAARACARPSATRIGNPHQLPGRWAPF